MADSINRPSVIVTRCICGWFDYFPTFDAAPSRCPRCHTQFPIPAIIGNIVEDAETDKLHRGETWLNVECP